MATDILRDSAAITGDVRNVHEQRLIPFFAPFPGRDDLGAPVTNPVNGTVLNPPEYFVIPVLETKIAYVKMAVDALFQMEYVKVIPRYYWEAPRLAVSGGLSRFMQATLGPVALVPHPLENLRTCFEWLRLKVILMSSGDRAVMGGYSVAAGNGFNNDAITLQASPDGPCQVAFKYLLPRGSVIQVVMQNLSPTYQLYVNGVIYGHKAYV